MYETIVPGKSWSCTKLNHLTRDTPRPTAEFSDEGPTAQLP